MQKGIFPYSFASQVPLDYVGELPTFNSFPVDNLTSKEYSDYVGSFSPSCSWSLRDETIKYCIQDCIVLYQVLAKFNTLIFNRFKVHIKKYPTLPSLAFGIFRVNYLGEAKIPKITGNIYNFIRKSYTGGAVDVYKVRPAPGEVVKGYDVNSLYPTSMSFFDIPVGSPVFFEQVDHNFDTSLLNSYVNNNLSTAKRITKLIHLVSLM